MTKPRPPRLAPIPLDEWDQPARAMLRGRLSLAEKFLSGKPDAPRMPNVLGVFGHNLPLSGAWLGFNGMLTDRPTIDPRHRELVVLRVAWQSRSDYEWVQHCRLAKSLDITPEQLEAITTGPDDPVWTTVERDLLLATDQLLDNYNIDDATWTRLAAVYDPGQLLELLFVIGAYVCLAMVFNAVGLELDPEMDPSQGPPISRP